MQFKRRRKNDSATEEAILIRNKRKFFITTILVIGNVLALSTATFAWFLTVTQNTQMSTISGDLNVNIKKVTAHKFVYPFYAGTTEFINYDEELGSIRSYIVEDSSISSPTSPSLETTIVLGASSGQTYTSSPSSNSATNVFVDNSQSFRYYLIGDEIFNGASINPWSTSEGFAFASSEEIDSEHPNNYVQLDNVLISVGSSFVFFDSGTISASTCSYFTYEDTPSNSLFETIKDQSAGIALTCLKSGIYSIKYWFDAETSEKKITLTLTGPGRPGDYDSIICNGVLDPTKISLDFAGSITTRNAYHDDIYEYLPTAIKEQNTLVVLDVELGYKNANPIDAGLKVLRINTGIDYINALTYSGSDIHEYGYNNERNPLNASNFYSFYALFTQTEFTASVSPARTKAENIWNYFHDIETGSSSLVDAKRTDDDTYNKFPNGGGSGNSYIECTMHLKESGDSTIVEPSVDQNGVVTETICHCYVAIEYDYAYSRFFMDQSRLGRTYLLDRDFGLYFTGAQHLEGD